MPLAVSDRQRFRGRDLWFLVFVYGLNDTCGSLRLFFLIDVFID